MADATKNVDLRPWLDPGGHFAWLFSLGLHAAALIAMNAATHSTPQGAASEVTRVGSIVLVARQGGEADYLGDQSPAVIPVSFVAPDATPFISLLDGLPSAAPIESALPPRNEVGSLWRNDALQNVETVVAKDSRPRPDQPPHGSAQPKAVETQVFGVRGKGSRFVYVFDRSSSMEGAPLAAAKRELIASLHSLQGVHQFQIIFYNDQPHVMPNFRGRSAAMVFADEPGKRLAANFIGSIFAHGATDHVQALRTALQMKPDVLFLLTDASEPQLRADELRLVRQLNQGTSINAIEFGLGPPPARYNFLHELAAENGGQHTYVDVTRLRR